MTFEEGLKDSCIEIVTLNNWISVARVTVKETGFLGAHYHRDAFELCELEKGKAKLYVRGEDESMEEIILQRFTLQEEKKENEDLTDGKVLSAGEEHCIYAEEGSVINFYRFRTHQGEPTQTDVHAAKDFQKLMQALLKM